MCGKLYNHLDISEDKKHYICKNLHWESLSLWSEIRDLGFKVENGTFLSFSLLYHKTLNYVQRGIKK